MKNITITIEEEDGDECLIDLVVDDLSIETIKQQIFKDLQNVDEVKDITICN